MAQSKELVKTWDQIAKTEAKELTKRPDERNAPAIWVHDLRGNLCLEAGCGGGRHSAFLSLRGNDVVNLDISKKMIDLCKENCKKLGVYGKNHFILGDVRVLPFKYDTFDLILCLGVIEHFQETSHALQGLVKVTKDSGMAIVSVPNSFSFFRVARSIAQGIGVLEIGYEKSYSKWYFESLLENVGLFDVKIALLEILAEEQASWKKIILRIIRILDKPFFLAGIGGHFLIAKGRKCPLYNIEG